MIPITASPPTLLPQNVTRLARSKSVPLHPVHLTRTQSRRSASLPSVFQFKPLPPTPQEMPSQHVPPSSRPTFHLAIDASDPEEYTCPHNLASTDSGDPDIVAVPSIPVHPLLHNPSITEREASRRYHALAELLSTELGYLLDLRTLVSVYTPPSLSVPNLRHPSQVYLRLLPVLKNRSSLPLAPGSSSNPTIGYFARPPPVHGLHSQFASLRTHSHPHLGGSTYSVTSAHPGDSHPSAPALPHSTPARMEKCTMRHLFSASDLDAITRNAEEILEFHESIVHQLRQVVSPFGISMSSRDILIENSGQSHRNSPINVNRAINAVSTVFVDYVRPSLSHSFIL